MKEMIEYVVKGIVDSPEDVRVNQVGGETSVIFELRCRHEDIGKVIGKNGRTVNAIRTLLNVMAARAGVRASLEVLDDTAPAS